MKKILLTALFLLLSVNCFAATKIAVATGNFTAAGTWLVADATSLSDSTAANTALTTSFQNSTAFTPGAITADGVAIHIASRAAGSPSNTITVRLSNGAADVVGTDVTMNVSDMPACSSTAITGDECGWYYFKFNVSGTPTPVLLLAATAYTLSIKLSATTTAVNVYSASGTNWSRFIPSTTTGAPAAGDNLHIMGDNLAAGTHNSYTVTMDNTATTSFGTLASSTASLTVNNFATLTWGTTASTNYYLKVKGKIRFFSGSILNFGTSGTRMPSTSTGILEFDCTSAVDSGIEFANGSTGNVYGATKNSYTLLTTDKSATNTVISGLTDTTGWAIGDTLVFESSTQTGSQVETKVISTVDSSTQVTLTAGLTNAHSGTAPTAIYVANLTRNIKMRGVSSTLVGYVYIANTATVNLDNVEITAIGNTGTNTRGIDVTTTTGSSTINNCPIHDGTVFTSIGINITGGTSNNFNITNNVIYFMNSGGLVLAATTNSSWTINANLIANTGSGSSGLNFSIGSTKGTITNNITSSAQNGGNMVIAASDTVGTFSGNSSHSPGGGTNVNVSITGSLTGGTLSTLTSWRGGTGLSVSNAQKAILDSAVFFGNSVQGLSISAGGYLEFNNCVFNAGVTQLQPIGISISSAIIKGNSNSFGATTAHSTGDISVSSNSEVYAKFNNTLFASTNEIANQSSIFFDGYIGSEKHDQVSGTNKTWRGAGTLSLDTTIFDTTPSLRMTPTSASIKLESLPFTVTAKSGSAITVSVKTRKSVVGDGTAYNGNEPRLIVKKNYSLGITADTVLATATSDSGTFQVITGTTASPSEDGVLSFVVDCDGTTGWVNVDTVTASPNNTSLGYKYWQDGSPVVYGNNSNASAGFVAF